MLEEEGFLDVHSPPVAEEAGEPNVCEKGASSYTTQTTSAVEDWPELPKTKDT